MASPLSLLIALRFSRGRRRGGMVSLISVISTIGIALGLFQFVFFCLMTWVYVRRANGEFDTLSEQIVQDAVRKA